MKLPLWWRQHFMRAEWILSLLLTLIFVGCYEYDIMPPEIVSALGGNRSALYATLASIFGSLLGFSITATSIVVAFINAPRLRIVRESSHYSTLWAVLFSTVRILGVATVIALAGLMFDQAASPKQELFSLMMFLFILSCFRLARTVWVLEKVVQLAAAGSTEKRTNEPGC
uniref:DUF2254 domain-containing protein n=1 Tax=Chlorobium phaeovibrioides (strain DSM 265 / 1930) TaxID=290318 RepID=A4SDT7_CHLPM